MADEYSFFTDSDDDRAVEDVLSQAMDHSILEQIAAINCSSFSNSDNLPAHLETRFRKLKSLPSTTTFSSAAAGSRFPPVKSKSVGPRSGDDSKIDEPNREFPSFEQIPDAKKSSVSSPSTDSPEDHSEEEKTGMKPSSITNSKQKGFKSRSGPSGGGSSTSGSDSGSTPSLSPPRSTGCLWCSPKKKKKKKKKKQQKKSSVCRKQGKENRLSCSSSLSSWGNVYDGENLKTFSIRDQKKMMKQAMKDEEKINREAEKIVKWAKQASARMMDASGLDDDLSLSDHEHPTNGK